MNHPWKAHAIRVPPNWTDHNYPWDTGYTPLFPVDECTHWQFWQSERHVTPISPIFPTAEDMTAYALANIQERYFEWAKPFTYQGCKRLLVMPTATLRTGANTPRTVSWYIA